MSLNARKYKQESKFKTPDALDPGTYPARVVQIISLGLQKQHPYLGEPKDPKDELYVTYELLDEFLLDEDDKEMEDKPRWISENFTMNSLDSDLAKSTKRYTAIDPDFKEDGNWATLTGYPCLVTIVQNKGKGKNADRVFNNISSVQTMRGKDASKAEELKNPPKVFDIDEPDMEVFLALPQFLQDRITGNLNFGGSVLEKLLEAHQGSSGGGSTQESEKDSQTPSQDVSDATDDENDEEDW